MKTYSGSIQHIVWTNHTELLVIADTIDTGLNLIKFKLTLDRSIQLTEQSRLKLDFAVLNVSYNRTANLLAIQSSDGLVFKYNENLSVIDEFQLPQACPTFQLLKNPTSGHEVYIGATQYYRLYVNGVEVANNCSSFYVHDEYLLFTDHANTLKFVDLSKIRNTPVIFFKLTINERIEIIVEKY